MCELSIITSMFQTAVRRLGFTFPIPKQLSEVARVPFLKQESAVRIRELWLEQFGHRQDVAVGTMAASEFNTFKANSVACPMFIVPVAKGPSAYMNLVTQIQDGKYCLVTSLESYRQNPDNAPPMMVIAIYDDLLTEKGIALMRGDIVNPIDITKKDAVSILKFLRYFYSVQFPLVQQFNKDPRNFDYEQFTTKCREFSLMG